MGRTYSKLGERGGMHVRFWSERDHQEDIEVDGRVILKWISER
jgi:hypothetical protein